MDEKFEKELLDGLSAGLLDYGFSVQKVSEETDEETDTLRVGFVTPGGLSSVMDITILHTESYKTVEFYFYVADDVSGAVKEKIAPVLEDVNAFAPLGHLGYLEEDLYFRYGYVLESDLEAGAAVDKIESLMELLIVVFDNCMTEIAEYVGQDASIE